MSLMQTQSELSQQSFRPMATTPGIQSLARPSSRVNASPNRLDQGQIHQHNEFALQYYNQGWTLPEDNLSALPTVASCPYHDTIFRLQDRPFTLSEAVSPTAITLQMIHDMPPFAIVGRTPIGTAASRGCTCAQVARGGSSRLATGRDGSTRGAATVEPTGQPQSQPLQSLPTHRRRRGSRH